MQAFKFIYTEFELFLALVESFGCFSVVSPSSPLPDFLQTNIVMTIAIKTTTTIATINHTIQLLELEELLLIIVGAIVSRFSSLE